MRSRLYPVLRFIAIACLTIGVTVAALWLAEHFSRGGDWKTILLGNP